MSLTYQSKGSRTRACALDIVFSERKERRFVSHYAFMCTPAVIVYVVSRWGAPTTLCRMGALLPPRGRGDTNDLYSQAVDVPRVLLTSSRLPSALLSHVSSLSLHLREKNSRIISSSSRTEPFESATSDAPDSSKSPHDLQTPKTQRGGETRT